MPGRLHRPRPAGIHGCHATHVALPANEELAPGLKTYFATAGRPENLPFVQLMLTNGLQQPDGIETNLGTAIGNLRQNL